MAAAMDAGSAHAVAVKGNTKHQRGPPHLRVAVAFLETLAVEARGATDPALKCKSLSLVALVVSIKTQTIEQVVSWLRSFRVADMPFEPGHKMPKVRVVYGIKGSLRVIPKSMLEQEEAAVAAARDEAAMGSWAKKWVNCWPELGEFVPVPGVEAAGRVAEVQQFLTSVLRAVGGQDIHRLARRLCKRADNKSEDEEQG